MSHEATPEQWAQIEQFVKDCGYDSCLLELRDRLAALENAANHFADASKTVPAPAGGLVERVAIAVCRCDDSLSWCEEVINWTPEARAAILAVAEWLEGIRALDADISARWLREEVERG